MLNDIELRGAFYYPACGTDLQPLLRFSHLTDLLIYADPQERVENVTAEFQYNLSQPPFAGRLEMIGQGRYVSESELGRTMQLPPQMARRLHEHEMARRHHFIEPRPWAWEFRFRRRIDGIERDLRLLYISGEGLATYSAFYADPTTSPLLLCSIQTCWGGVDVEEALEAADGLHEEFLLHFRGPRIWIRGNWVRRWPLFETYPPREEGQWNRRVQDYTGWQCFDYERNPVFATVAAFATEDDELGLESETVLEGSGQQSVRFVKRQLEFAELEDFDAAFVSPRPYEHLQQRETPCAIYQHDDGAFPEVLERIRQLAADHGFRRIVMTGRGYEDEGAYFQHWIDDQTSPLYLEVRIVHDLDLADQRGWHL